MYLCVLVVSVVLYWFLGFCFVFAQVGGRGRLVLGIAARACAFACVFVSFVAVCGCVCWGQGEGVYASRFRVYRHQAHMFFSCGLGAGSHGDVLNVHSWVFQRVMAHLHTTHHTPHTHHHSHSHSHSHSHTQQPTNLRLNVPQHGKTHQVQTQ